jgi:hypothetical protein
MRRECDNKAKNPQNNPEGIRLFAFLLIFASLQSDKKGCCNEKIYWFYFIGYNAYVNFHPCGKCRKRDLARRQSIDVGRRTERKERKLHGRIRPRLRAARKLSYAYVAKRLLVVR